MVFDLPEEHEALRDTVRDFAEREIAPVAAELDRTKTFPYEIVRKLGELGWMGIPFPEEYGGAGADTLAYVVAVEELARVDSSVAITLCAHTSLGTQPIYLHGTEEQRREWLPRLTSGELLAAFGLTEPEAGSDAGNTRTRAVLDDGEWVIDGAKQFITNAGTEISGVVSITAVTGDDDGRREISNLLVPNGTPGFEVGEPYEKMGWHASDTRPLAFDGCRVPEAQPARRARRGPAGSSSRCSTSAGSASPRWASGLAQGAFDQALRYSRERHAFGQPIAPLPGDRGEARRHVDRDRGGAAAHLPGGPPQGRRPALRARRRPGEAEVGPRRACRWPTRPSRSTAATATSRSTRCAASTATPRSSRSARAQTRSSAS